MFNWMMKLGDQTAWVQGGRPICYSRSCRDGCSGGLLSRSISGNGKKEQPVSAIRLLISLDSGYLGYPHFRTPPMYIIYLHINKQFTSVPKNGGYRYIHSYPFISSYPNHKVMMWVTMGHDLIINPPNQVAAPASIQLSTCGGGRHGWGWGCWRRLVLRFSGNEELSHKNSGGFVWK